MPTKGPVRVEEGAQAEREVEGVGRRGAVVERKEREGG